MNGSVVKGAFRSSSLLRHPAVIGDSPASQELRRLIQRVGRTDAGVLVSGESGAGKEFVARLIHAGSSRGGGPFVAFNCDAVPADLLEYELFGYERDGTDGSSNTHPGALERAAGGTLFLDDIARMSAETQSRLLRVLEMGRFYRVGGIAELSSDVRIIAASTRAPQQLAQQGTLRDDILYRLAVFPLAVPSLRDRGRDMVALAEHFLALLNAREKSSKRLSEASRGVLLTYDWPGNVRELKNCIERAFVLCDDWLELTPLVATKDVPAGDGRLEIRVGSSIDQAERSLIEATLQHYRGNKRRTADTLGCSLKTLYNKLHAYARTEGRLASG